MEAMCDTDEFVPSCHIVSGRHLLLQVKACSKHNISLDFCNPYEEKKKKIRI